MARILFPVFALFMALQANAQPVRIIMDTDFALDVDDAGSLAILHHLADMGECEILGVIVSSSSKSYDGKWAVPAINAINTWYGRPDIPVGAYKGPCLINDQVSKYTRQVQAAFPHKITDGDSVMEGFKLYRKILASQPDASVVILSTGFLNNLDELLHSKPDEFSPYDGMELVSKKVKEWACMGGSYPEGREEFNFNTYAECTREVLKLWPCKASFVGWEFGDRICTGAILNKKYKKKENPVAMCFYYYCNGNNRSSWDEITTLYAVRGLSKYFDAVKGWNRLFAIEPASPGAGRGKSYNEWKNDINGNQQYLIPKIPANVLQDELDQLMSTLPKPK